MACSSCYSNPSPCPACSCDPTPVPNPEPIPIICPDPEPCDNLQDVACVVYTGEDLPCIPANTDDRLDVILQAINDKLCNIAAGGLYTNDTNCISLSGDGTQGNPLEATPIIDGDPDNILECGDNGLTVVIDEDVILNILNIITGSTTLSQMFCTMVQNCGNATCGLNTNLQVEMV